LPQVSELGHPAFWEKEAFPHFKSKRKKGRKKGREEEGRDRQGT